MSKAPKPARQGGMAQPHTAPSRTSGMQKQAGTVPTPGMGQSWAKNTNIRPKPSGGSGETSAKPKSF